MSHDSKDDVLAFLKDNAAVPPKEPEGHLHSFVQRLEQQKKKERLKRSSWIIAFAALVLGAIFLSQYEYKKVSLDELDEAFADSLYIEEEGAEESYSYSPWDELGESLTQDSGS